MLAEALTFLAPNARAEPRLMATDWSDSERREQSSVGRPPVVSGVVVNHQFWNASIPASAVHGR